MLKEVSKTHGSLSGINCQTRKEFQVGRDYALDEMPALLPKVGIGFSDGVIRDLLRNYGMDAANIQGNLTTASLTTPVQFLQEWLPGFVAIITAARKGDELFGVSTVGAWEDEMIVQQVLEMTGAPTLYSDTGMTPLTNWNLNFVERTNVRFEQGMRVGTLEQSRAARVRISSDAQKRASCGIQLEIQRNAVCFYGYNSGNNLTYGGLTDPNLPNYITVAEGTTSDTYTWSTKTFLEIQTDLLNAIQQLRTNSQDTISPDSMACTLAVPTDCIDYLAKTSDFGISVRDWLKQFYPQIRIVSAPQLNNANSTANVFYLYADSVQDGLSTDDNKTFIQVVPARFQLLGVAKLSKGYEEAYSNATAGIMLKRPYAVVRYTGI